MNFGDASTYTYPGTLTIEMLEEAVEYMLKRSASKKDRELIIYGGQGLYDQICKKLTKEEKLDIFKQKIKQYVV